MSNHTKNNPVDDIIDLTEVVSIGSGVGVAKDALQDEDDVLDSLVHEFEGNSAKADSDDDGALDLSNLDDLINSYNLNFDENKDQENELDSDFDAILNDIKNDGDQADNDSDLPDKYMQQAEKEDFSKGDGQVDDGFGERDNAFSEENEIDALTRDIINGAEPADNVLDSDMEPNQNELSELEDVPDSFLDELDKQLGEESADFSADGIGLARTQAADGKQFGAAGFEDDLFADANEMALEHEAEENGRTSADMRNFEQALHGEKDTELKPSLEDFDSFGEKDNPPKSESVLRSDMAQEEAEDITDEAFNDILNELSLDHELDEEVVPFAKDAAEENMPIRLNGDISFIENSEKEKPADVHLVQSASKVLDSDEAYLEKFEGEDESVGAKLKTLSNNFASLEQRLLGSDSKWQDMGLEINYRIGGLENRVSGFEENTKAELSLLKSVVDKCSRTVAAVSDISAQTDGMERLQEKVHGLESRIATLDDIFSEQKMLNDELAKTLDNQRDTANSSHAGKAEALEAQIAALQQELAEAQAKIAAMEENIEKMASLAAAKVLREEIIPLLTKE